MFPFARFPGVDPVLSPEMKSTGEVMGIDRDFATAFAKAQLGAGTVLPTAGTVFVSVKDSDKPVILPAVRALVELGFTIVATGGTARLSRRRRACRSSGSTRWRRAGRISSTGSRTARSTLIFNTTEGWQILKDSQSIRASALTQKIPVLHHRAGQRRGGAGDRGACGRAALKYGRLQSYYSQLARLTPRQSRRRAGGSGEGRRRTGF